ncbi:hypothetical protein F0562_006053 [Nyssa sinensis]|uniref:Rhamnogalacturonan lyase domain-containing protein n=1 Tax=Nyssa sinensis TaxID=561372 RepID=A0A5J5AM45_9ASTE|nr:hypothetical protein F0562_006053 [Nyssa sinensis]
MDEDDLTDKILDGLGDDYQELIRAVQARDTMIKFDELHEKLLNFEASLQGAKSKPSHFPASANPTNCNPTSWRPSFNSGNTDNNWRPSTTGNNSTGWQSFTQYQQSLSCVSSCWTTLLSQPPPSFSPLSWILPNLWNTGTHCQEMSLLSLGATSTQYHSSCPNEPHSDTMATSRSFCSHHYSHSSAMATGQWFYYMAVLDERQRVMPTERDQVASKVLDYQEVVLLTNLANPKLKGEVDDKYQYSSNNKDNRVRGWICSNPSTGFWVITPNDEFRVAGPLKQELTSYVYINKELKAARSAYVGLAASRDAGSYQTENKGYQFWTQANVDGYFLIKGARARNYSLYAWVLGILGDYKYDIYVDVTPG